jgi:hypothetical protein
MPRDAMGIPLDESMETEQSSSKGPAVWQRLESQVNELHSTDDPKKKEKKEKKPKDRISTVLSKVSKNNTAAVEGDLKFRDSNAFRW